MGQIEPGLDNYRGRNVGNPEKFPENMNFHLNKKWKIP
jgi:hypothetical protein